jgi:hypothetical protein
MQIGKHKTSGKYFIYLCDTADKAKALFITPDADEQTLRLDLFEKLEDVEEGRESEMLTQAQIQAWHKCEDEMFSSRGSCQ